MTGGHFNSIWHLQPFWGEFFAGFGRPFWGGESESMSSPRGLWWWSSPGTCCEGCGAPERSPLRTSGPAEAPGRTLVEPSSNQTSGPRGTTPEPIDPKAFSCWGKKRNGSPFRKPFQVSPPNKKHRSALSPSFFFGGRRLARNKVRTVMLKCEDSQQLSEELRSADAFGVVGRAAMAGPGTRSAGSTRRSFIGGGGGGGGGGRWRSINN